MTKSGIESDEASQQAWQRLQRLNQRLLAANSATMVLEAWCGGSAAAGLQVVKHEGPVRPMPPELQGRLGVAGGESPEYRSVALVYAGHTVSEAENWYYPSRLGPAMRQALEQGDQPFGRVVKALDFVRETLSVDWLWQPGQHPQTDLPWALLRHQAVLRRGDGLPFSAVIETYTRAVLSFK
ncbi:hypothetical protein ACYJW8_06960 [Frateuria aurantia]